MRKLKTLLPLVLIAITVLSLLPLITAPPLKVGAIAGTVIDSDTGLPIEGATVTADGYSASTEADGTYLLADLSVGDYIVEASAAGYESASASATVEHKETTTVDFALVPIPPPRWGLRRLTVAKSVCSE